MNLDDLLIVRPAHLALKAKEIIIHLEGTTAFTERGAVKLAECLCKLDERPIVRVQVATSMLDFEFVNSVVSIVYLQGNKPELYVRDPNRGHRVSEEFDHRCRQLQQNYEYLTECEFRQDFGKAASIQFAMSLHGNTALKKLTLRFDNDLSTDQGHSLAAAICNSAVTSLAIRNRWPSIESGGEGLKVLLQEGIQASGRLLETLEIDAMNQKLITNGLAEIIPCVESLSLTCMDFALPEDRSHFRSLCEKLGRTSHLLGLTLQRCELDDDATRMLFNALHNNRSMTRLSVIDCHIGDAGVASFVENWPEDSKLEQLDLRANHVISTRGVHRLMTALPNRRALKTLNIMGNCFGFREVEMIGNYLPNLKIREIYVGDVMFEVDEMRRIRVMDRWLQGIKANHFLQTIYMVRNRSIRLELMDEIDFYTKLNKYGRYLLPIANDVPPALWCLIFAKARIEREFNLSIIYYFLVELPHLVNERKRRKRRTDQPPITGRNARLRSKTG
jgi:hypothetical protein